MHFRYKHVLMIGATSGIGAAMADRLVKEGSKVIAVGRRQERLDGFVHKHGKDKAGAVRFDINDRQNMDQFVKTSVEYLASGMWDREGGADSSTSITHTYPDIDCVFLNAGVQSHINLAEPEQVNLSDFHSEIATNFTCFVDLTMKFLPFLMRRNAETALIYTGSNLAIIPAATLPAYSASKAALNAFVLCLREQLRDSSVKVIELSPPPVQSMSNAPIPISKKAATTVTSLTPLPAELHDYMGEQGQKLGMPVEEFTDVAYKGLASGSDQVIVGAIGPVETFNEIIDKRRTTFQNLSKMMRGGK